MKIRIVYTNNKEVEKKIPTEFMELTLIEIKTIFNSIVRDAQDIQDISILGKIAQNIMKGLFGNEEYIEEVDYN